MRSEKQLLLDEIKDKIQSSNAMIVTNYQAFTPNVSWDFRDRLRGLNGSYEIVKKRVFIKAAEECGMEVDLKDLDGHIGVLFAETEPVEPAKFLFQFNKENGAELKVLFGKFDGQTYSSEDVEKLSKLPGMQDMRAQFIGLLEAPMSQTLSVMQSLLTSVMYCLQNKSEQTS
ncbi:MAG: 50S ribosomal protein L10 [Chlamydiota bacterium]|jgi:large subunit ribosomal protein L10